MDAAQYPKARKQNPRLAPVLQIGAFRLEGRSAGVVLLSILLLFLGWLIYKRPWMNNWPLWLSGAGWVAFNIYWSVAARNSAPAKKSESPESRRIHQYLLSAALLLLFIPIPGLQQRFLPATPIVVLAGLTLQAACGLLGVWARRHLGAQWSGQVAVKVEPHLVRSGPYRVLRHPIYTAWLGMYAGPAIVSGQLHAFLAVALVAFAYGRKILIEEAALHQAFGQTYASYRRDTWALIPWLF
ncbi:MAG TPA: isoprenylcysteine carboxylmethyltransferase family protein [Bryobacteraceae bacterium]|nr:isoprenylcysteine carboxylmethyltransferase family protein [Bryobacteraceae bacterium]